MVNSTVSIFIKPTVAFNRGDTFVFGSWVYMLTAPDPSSVASPCRPTRRLAS
jgi:hypothetical protein